MFKNEKWYLYLDEAMRGLVDEAFYLLDREEISGEDFFDYSFVVFPIAKGYEGFLKKFLFDLSLISEEDLVNKHFRIGRSLNPNLPIKFRDEKWLFDDLVRMCEIKEGEKKKLPRMIWQAWKKGRNGLFHYFADKDKSIDLIEARKRIDDFVRVMELAVECVEE